MQRYLLDTLLVKNEPLSVLSRRRSLKTLIKTTSVPIVTHFHNQCCLKTKIAGLAPFIPSMGANVGYPNAGADHRVELLWHPSARFGHRNQCAVF